MKYKLTEDRTTLALTAVTLSLAGLAWWRGGPALALAGLLQGSRILLSVVPLLTAAFLIAGLIQALITKQTVTHWLGVRSGWRGIALACIGGALIPGGPYVYYPIAGAVMHAGASLGVLIAFVTAKNLWSATRLPMEFALLGTHLTLVRLAVTVILPPLMGVAAEALFGTHVDSIREAVSE